MIETHALEANISGIPLKDYCKAIPPQGRRCELDYEKFPNNLQRWCEEAGGQHVLSYYMATCDAGVSYSLQLAVSSEPGCVATVCRADDTTMLLEQHATARVMARLEGGGNFNCTLSHFRSRQPKPQFDKKIILQTNPPTPPPLAALDQTKKPFTYDPYIPPSTDAPKPEDPSVYVESSGGISSHKLNVLLFPVVASFFSFL